MTGWAITRSAPVPRVEYSFKSVCRAAVFVECTNYILFPVVRKNPHSSCQPIENRMWFEGVQAGCGPGGVRSFGWPVVPTAAVGIREIKTMISSCQFRSKAGLRVWMQATPLAVITGCTSLKICDANDLRVKSPTHFHDTLFPPRALLRHDHRSFRFQLSR